MSCQYCGAPGPPTCPECEAEIEARTEELVKWNKKYRELEAKRALVRGWGVRSCQSQNVV